MNSRDLPDKKFDLKSTYDLLLNQTSAMTKIECECVKSYKFLDMVIHRTREQVDAHMCDTCGYIYDEERFLKIHMLSEHTPVGFSCDGTEYATCIECETSVHFDAIKDHLDLHEDFYFIGKDPIQCKFCGWKNDYMVGQYSCCITHKRIRFANEHMKRHMMIS
jgi:rubredoxin